MVATIKSMGNAVKSPTEFSSFVEILSYRAIHQPHQTAYIFLVDGETVEARLTYQELDQKAQAIAALLQSQGATGERALLLYPQGLEFITAFFGCLYAGVTAVPVYPPRRNQREQRLQAIVADAKAKFALTTTTVLANIERGLNQELTALHCLATDYADNFRDAKNYRPTSINPLAFLQYTSGSTGTPKGVMLTHGNLLHNSDLIYRHFGHSAASWTVTWLPPYHDMGLIGGMLQPLYGGYPVTLMSSTSFLQKPYRWLQAISRYQATTSGGPNFAYDLCVQKITAEERQTLDLSSWEVAFSGGEPIRAATFRQFAETFAYCGFRSPAFYPCYGLAESTLFVAGHVKNSEPVIEYYQPESLEQNRAVLDQNVSQGGRALVSSGLVNSDRSDHQVLIVNPESLVECAEQEVGEIWVSGASVAAGYWQQPQVETFQAHLINSLSTSSDYGQFLRTGDLGFIRDRQLFITGRLKDLIIIRGRNYYPQDIELTVEQSHSMVAANCGAAFAVECNGTEKLVIVQEIAREHFRNFEAEPVIAAIRQAVSQEHELSVYAVLLLKPLSLPKTSSGKIQRRACREGFLHNTLDIVGNWIDHQAESRDLSAIQLEDQNLQNLPTVIKPVITKEAIQVWLINQLASCLKLEPDDIDINQPFSYYGLDSSLAISLTGGLAEWLGHDIEPTIFWEYPSIEGMAQYLGLIIGIL